MIHDQRPLVIILFQQLVPGSIIPGLFANNLNKGIIELNIHERSLNICERISHCSYFFYLYHINEIKPAYSKESCNNSLIGILPKGWWRSLSSQLAARK